MLLKEILQFVKSKYMVNKTLLSNNLSIENKYIENMYAKIFCNILTVL